MDKAKTIVKFLTKKPKVLAIYRSFKDLEIVTFSKTRFAYVFLILDRLLKIHPTLEQMVVCNAWQD